MIQYPCPACGAETGEWRAIGPIRTHVPGQASLFLTASLLGLATCVDCEAFWFDEGSSTRLENAMEAAQVDPLRFRVEWALNTLQRKRVRLSNIERTLELSPGYLSKLKAGKRASGPLVALLLLLAQDPRLLEEVYRMLNPR